MKNPNVLFFLAFCFLLSCFADPEDCWVYENCEECLADPDCNSFCDWGFGQGFCELGDCATTVVDLANECSSSTLYCDQYICDECFEAQDCEWCSNGTESKCFNPSNNQNGELCTTDFISNSDEDCEAQCSHPICANCLEDDNCNWCIDQGLESCKQKGIECEIQKTTCQQQTDCSVHNNNCGDCVEIDDCWYFESLNPSVQDPVNQIVIYQGRCVNNTATLGDNEVNVTKSDSCQQFTNECNKEDSCDDCLTNDDCRYCIKDSMEPSCQHYLFTQSNSELCDKSMTSCSTPEPTPTKDNANNLFHSNYLFYLCLLLLLIIIK
ncbi:hypothetical protein M0812_10561 [Anaeramoeba flamelloides]|uniref:Uncharacterized protein n=1 Tax=Anaeramoeba flamelloides TaxID=1746091 RepID=A0AAV7ZRX2_9EUKA|nr:hypothetical protein M0812_10561 [Anaeramoeba flamelloides]